MRSGVYFFGDSRSDETEELEGCCWVTSGDGVEEGERHSSEFGVSDGVDGVASRDGGDYVELSRVAKRKERPSVEGEVFETRRESNSPKTLSLSKLRNRLDSSLSFRLSESSKSTVDDDVD